MPASIKYRNSDILKIRSMVWYIADMVIYCDTKLGLIGEGFPQIFEDKRADFRRYISHRLSQKEAAQINTDLFCLVFLLSF